MKKIYWAGILAVFSIGICALCLIYVTDASEKAKDYVEKIQESVTKCNYESAREEANKLDEFWEEKHTILSMLVHHKNLETIEESVELIKTSLENIDPDSSIDCEMENTRALSRIKNLRDVELPSISNIF